MSDLSYVPVRDCRFTARSTHVTVDPSFDPLVAHCPSCDDSCYTTDVENALKPNF